MENARIDARSGRTWRRLAVVVAALAAVAIPAVVWASHFDDVPNSHTHHDGIAWLADNDITAGCGGADFCPGDAVNRGQMGTFMHNLGGYVAPAGLHVTRDGADMPVVDRFFNNVNGVAPTITINSGAYDIDMGFDVTDSIVQCSVDTNHTDTRDAFCTTSTPSGDTVRVRIHDISAGGDAPAEFFVTVSG